MQSLPVIDMGTTWLRRYSIEQRIMSDHGVATPIKRCDFGSTRVIDLVSQNFGTRNIS